VQRWEGYTQVFQVYGGQQSPRDEEKSSLWMKWIKGKKEIARFFIPTLFLFFFYI